MGGFAAVAAADDFKTHYDIDPIMVLASSAPLFMRSFPLSLVEKLVDGFYFPDFGISISMALVFLAYSQTRPGMENSDAGQSFLKPVWAEQFVTIFQDPNAIDPNQDLEGFFAYFITNYPQVILNTDVLDPGMIAFYQDAIEREDADPCKNSSVDTLREFGMEELCAALDANDLTDLIEAAEFPVSACHSDVDEIVPYDSIPEDILTYTINDIGHAYATSHCFPLLMDSLEIEKPKIKVPKSPKSPKAPKSAKKKKKF